MCIIACLLMKMHPRCWVNLANPIAYGTMIPIGVASVVTLIATEATGQAAEIFKTLPTVQKSQVNAAQ